MTLHLALHDGLAVLKNPVLRLARFQRAGVAVFDGFPVSPGHTLVITRRLVATWFDATPAEQAAVMELVAVVKQQLDAELQPRPDGYNVGFNCGAVAGQTVSHLHVHVIPRYRGDVADPRGGVRHVIPAKANYLTTSISPAQRANLTSGQGNALDHAFDRLQSPAQRASPMSGRGNALDPATPTNISPSPNGAALTSAASTPHSISAPDTSSLTLSTGHPDSPLWDQLSWRPRFHLRRQQQPLPAGTAQRHRMESALQRQPRSASPRAGSGRVPVAVARRQSAHARVGRPVRRGRRKIPPSERHPRIGRRR